MAKRESEEARIIRYFRNGGDAEVALMFSLVKGEMKARVAQTVTRTRVPKVRATPASDASV